MGKTLVAKSKNQNIPFTDTFYNIDDSPVFWGQQVRWTAKTSTTLPGMDPETGSTRKTTKGRRPRTRVKRVNGLWFDRRFDAVPFDPDTIPMQRLYPKLPLQITWRTLLKKLGTFWHRLPKSVKNCWCALARAAGQKCGCLDYFINRQFNYWKVHGDFDSATCQTCPPLSIIYTTKTMIFNSTQALCANTTEYGPYYWYIISGGGTLLQTQGVCVTYQAPSSNPYCLLNPTIKVMDRCNQSATIKLAITNPSIAYPAYRKWKADFVSIQTSPWWICGHQGPLVRTNCNLSAPRYKCDGSWHSVGLNRLMAVLGVSTTNCCSLNPQLRAGTLCEAQTTTCIGIVCCSPAQFWGWKAHLYTDAETACIPYPLCDQVQDLRTDSLKQQGCCPINPATGDPF